jgi:hypothetical protein
MDFIALISNFFGAVKGFFGYQNKKLDLKNAPDVKAAAQAQNEVSARDKTEAAISGKDAAEIRKELSE